MGTNIRVIQPRGTSVSINRQGTQKNIRSVVTPSSVTGGGASTLDQLTDVNTNGVANNDVLVYDANSGQFVPGDIVIDDGTF